MISEAYLQGISTRKVESLMEPMGATGVSRSEVSRVASMLDEEVDAFRSRQLTKRYTHLYLDATYIKSREQRRTHSRALLIACAVSEEGEREVIRATRDKRMYSETDLSHDLIVRSSLRWRDRSRLYRTTARDVFMKSEYKLNNDE